MRSTVGVRVAHRTRSHLFEVASPAVTRYGKGPCPSHSTSPASRPPDLTREDPYLRILSGSLRRCLLTQKVLPVDMMIPLKQLALPATGRGGGGGGGLVLVPKGIQHARFEAKVGGKGSWVMCHHGALEQLALRGSYKRVNARLSMPKDSNVLTAWTASLLARRVGQEVEMFCERAKSWPKLEAPRSDRRTRPREPSGWIPVRKIRSMDRLDELAEMGQVEMVLDLSPKEDSDVVKWRKRSSCHDTGETPVWSLGRFLRDVAVSPRHHSPGGSSSTFITATSKSPKGSEDSTWTEAGVASPNRTGLVGSITSHLDSTISLFERRLAREASSAPPMPETDRELTQTSLEGDEGGEIYVFYSPPRGETQPGLGLERTQASEGDATTVARMRRDLVDLWISCWRIGLWTGQGWEE